MEPQCIPWAQEAPSGLSFDIGLSSPHKASTLRSCDKPERSWCVCRTGCCWWAPREQQQGGQTCTERGRPGGTQRVQHHCCTIPCLGRDAQQPPCLILFSSIASCGHSALSRLQCLQNSNFSASQHRDPSCRGHRPLGFI